MSGKPLFVVRLGQAVGIVMVYIIIRVESLEYFEYCDFVILNFNTALIEYKFLYILV
jgi:hypothetical protein